MSFNKDLNLRGSFQLISELCFVDGDTPPGEFGLIALASSCQPQFESLWMISTYHFWSLGDLTFCGPNLWIPSSPKILQSDLPAEENPGRRLLSRSACAWRWWAPRTSSHST